jgi:glycosyltransferase involved in cell wall biosynthesis
MIPDGSGLGGTMKNKPLVSVIMIFLNAEKFMQEAIASVIAQSYETWELLLVDDGSTDQSTAIARRYAEDYPGKVRYLEHEGHRNRGMSATRNLGIDHAKGVYIAFLDADDVWLPHKLQQQVAVLESQPGAAMVYGPSQYWQSWTGAPEASRRDYVLGLGVEPDTLVRPPTLLALSLLSRAPTPCPSDVLVRREIVEHVGGFEEIFRGMYEDQAFLAKVYLTAPVFVSGECWDRYRLHPDSSVAVATREGDKYTAGLFYLAWLESYLLAHRIRDADVWRALRKKRRRYRHPDLYRVLQRTQHRARQAKTSVGRLARRLLPTPVRRWLRAHWGGEMR